LFCGFMLMLLLNRIILIFGGLGQEWLACKDLLLILFQSDLTLLFAVLSIPFLFAPVSGGLFRGGGTLILSATLLILAFAIPQNNGLLDGLFPFRFKDSDPFIHKSLVCFQSVFTLPVPRVFMVKGGIEHVTGLFLGSGSPYTLWPGVLERAGYWWWTFFNGLIIQIVALILWIRKEHS